MRAYCGSAPRLLAVALAGVAVGLGPSPAGAQASLGGLSINKLQLPSADPVPEGRVEVATVWNMGWYARRFGTDRRVVDPQRLDTEGAFGLRMTVGLFEAGMFGLEIGSVLPVRVRWSEDRANRSSSSAAGFGDVPLALKLRLMAARRFSFALAFGGRAPTGNRVDGLTDGYGRVSAGIIFASNPIAGLTVDFSWILGGTPGMKTEDFATVPAVGSSFALALGWLFERGWLRRLSPIVELRYRVYSFRSDEASGADNPSSDILSFSFGLTFQVSKRIFFMQGVDVDVYGRNAPRGTKWLTQASFLL